MSTTITSKSSCMCSELGPQASRPKAVADEQLAEIVRFHGHLCPGLARRRVSAARKVEGSGRRPGGWLHAAGAGGPFATVI